MVVAGAAVMPNDNLMDWDWPVDVSFNNQPIGRLAVKGLMGNIYKYVLMPAYAPDDNGVLRVVSWSFVPREQVLKPEMIAQLEAKEEELTKNERA